MWPPAAVVETIATLKRPKVDGLRWTTEDQWHATLRFLGDADITDASAALASIDAAPARAVMGPVTDRFGQATLHVPVSGLDALADAVAIVFGPEDRPFHGHLTLGRARSRRGVDLRPLCGVPLAGEWPVDEVTLVASELHPNGARYTVVARVPLH